MAQTKRSIESLSQTEDDLPAAAAGRLLLRHRGWGNLPNILSYVRMVLSLWMLVVTPLESAFFVLFTLAGFSDLVDGPLARRLDVADRFGTLVDSVADLLLIVVVAIRVGPAIDPPGFIVVVVAAILAFKLLTWAIVWLRTGWPTVLHTPIHRLTGGLAFLSVYVIDRVDIAWWGGGLCGLALIGALHEAWIQMMAPSTAPIQSE